MEDAQAGILLEAFVFAAHKHRDHRRKDPDQLLLALPQAERKPPLFTALPADCRPSAS